MTPEALLRFESARKRIIGADREQKGIGTLGEKTLHAVLKHYFEPDPSFHEIKCGTFYADIFNAEGITEIQTRSFNVLRRKLDFFLDLGSVRIVYPIAAIKYLRWIDPETGALSPPRKSPKRATACECFYELYKIKPYLTHPNLHLCVLLLEIEELRLKNGWSADGKKGSSRFERIPLQLMDELRITHPADYAQLLPASLPDRFTTADLRKHANLSLSKAQTAANVLHSVGVISPCGKAGRAVLYERAT